MKKTLTIILAAAVLLTPLHLSNAYDLGLAKNYLLSNANNPWVTMGLAALGHSSIPITHLKSVSSNSAIGYTTPILAITALGSDPSSYVNKLKSFYRNGQVGDPAALNDDIFSILALVSAGEKNSQEAIGSKSYLLSKQNSDGGWGWSTIVGSDTNMTAAAITALISTGMSALDSRIQKALNYLKSAQNSDGGFPYDPNSSFAKASDSSSTAWVIWALNAADISSSSWVKSGNTPTSYLNNLQVSQGYFEYQNGSGENSLSPANTAYAVIALQGKTLPLKIIDSSTSSETTVGKFSFKIQGKDSTICQGSAAGPSALDIVRNATSLCSYTYEIRNTSFGPYLYRINNESAQGSEGWLYTVNGRKPNIGAADYTLKAGDNVVWFYDNADSTGPSDNNNESVSATAKLRVTVEQPEEVVQPQRVVSFSINLTNINFGTLRPGQTSSRNVTLINNGNVNLNVKASVTGDSLFTANLRLGSQLWSAFIDLVNKNRSRTHRLNLSVPSNYSGEGEKAGEIIFWATPSE